MFCAVKPRFLITHVFTVLFLLVLSSHAAVLLDDTWADGNRTSTSLPTDSAWYASTASSLTAAVNSLTATPSTISRTWWTYFTTNVTAPVSLNVGETLKVTLAFIPSGVVALNGNFGLHVGLYNY